MQVAVPSRGGVEAYQRIRSLIEELIGNIQGTFGIPDWSPVRYLHRSLSRRDVVALYRAADVLLVTPVRDGMNLVAKEFVASRNDEDGVLLLSEFAGAAAELPDAVAVNPYDVAGSAQAIYEALNLSRDERRVRMKRMRERVFTHDGASWAKSFLETLEVARRWRKGDKARWLVGIDRLDYTKGIPGRVQPDEPLLQLLQRLAERSHTHVHIVSGRTRADLQRWLGELPLHLHAEHGLWSRRLGADWQRLPVTPLPARASVRQALEELQHRLPGSRVEEKEESLVFHWRACEPRFAERQVRELELTLRVQVGGEAVRIERGASVLEVRHAAGSKSLAAHAARASAGDEALLVAIGDDTTDEELFEAVRPQGVAIKVGGGESCADARLEDVAGVRQALAGLLG